MQQISGSFGRFFTFAYDAEGRLETLTTSVGTVSYSYDDNDNLAQVICPDGSSRRYLYEDADPHNITGIIDENNIRILSVDYDEHDRAVAVEQAGRTEAVEYLANRQRAVTDIHGITTLYSLEIRHGIIAVKKVEGPGCGSCGGSDSSYVYNDRLQVIRRRGPGLII